MVRTSRFVADTKRTFTLRYAVSPTRRMARDSSTRRSLGCSAIGSSATSSRKTVPPSAASMAPTRAAAAPVNAPLVCPKSSASSNVSGSAPQSTMTKGFAAREELSWMAAATSSLPVPVSPWTRTVESVRAILASRAKSSRMGRLLPSSGPKRSAGHSSTGLGVFS